MTLAYPASPIMVEQTYLFTIIPAVSGTPTSFTITGGSVPANVTWIPGGGAFRGFVWQESFTVTVLASNGVSTASATITVQPSYQPITLQYPETNDGSPMMLLVDTPYSLEPLVSGGGAPYGLAYALSAGALPPGMTLDTNPGSATLGTISGTLNVPDVGQTYTATIQVTGHQGPTGAAAIASAVVTITVASPGPAPDLSVVYPTTGFDNDASPRAAGLLLQVQLYSGNAVTLYPVTSGVVTNVARPSGISADDSGLALNANTGVLSGTLMQRNYVPESLTTTFQYQQLLRVSGAAGVADVISSVNMAITSPDQADYPPLWQANVGDVFDTQLYINGLTATRFSLVNPNALPTGLSFYEISGRIYGTPAVGTEGTYDINVTITYPPLYATALKVRFNTLTVNPPLTSQAAPSIKFPAFVDPLTLTVGIPVFLPVALSGSVSTFSLSSNPLPPGLSFNPSDGSISGTPTAAFTQPSYTVTVTATGPGGTASDTLTMTVVYAPLTVYYPTPAKCDAGSPLIIMMADQPRCFRVPPILVPYLLKLPPSWAGLQRHQWANNRYPNHPGHLLPLSSNDWERRAWSHHLNNLPDGVSQSGGVLPAHAERVPQRVPQHHPCDHSHGLDLQHILPVGDFRISHLLHCGWYPKYTG